MAYSDDVEALDRAAMASLGGEAITYTPTVGSPPPAPVSVTGIFDANFALAKGGANAGVEALVPAVFFRLSDLPTDPNVDDPTLTIRGNVYRVIERMPDDQGGIVLIVRTTP